MKHRSLSAACTLLLLPLAACTLTEPTSAGTGRTVSVDSSATDCRLSRTTVGSGRVAFTIRNTGSEVTEFYLYAADGSTVVGEVENIGPGLTRDLVLTAQPGRYTTACRPGMKGTGIRAGFTVTGKAVAAASSAADRAATRRAERRYAGYVRRQADELLTRTTAFTAAYRAGLDEKARALYAAARLPWERIEPVAESFGDLDPRIDLREAQLEPGQQWTGFHRIEKDLWPPATGYAAATPAERRSVAAALLADVTTLHRRVRTLDYPVDRIGNGAKSLLDEVAIGKITGEEEVWSHTDLVDFQGNLDGARVAFETLEGLLRAKDPALATEIEQGFASAQRLLSSYRTGDGFLSYAAVGTAGRKALSVAVDALSEPLSKLTGVLTS